MYSALIHLDPTWKPRTMTSVSCPPREGVLRFLDEQLDLAQRSEIGTHVDACQRCQEWLEELTRGHAYGLSVLIRDLVDKDPGYGPEESIQECQGPGTEAESAAALDGDSSGDADRTEPPGEPDASTVDRDPSDSDQTTDSPLSQAVQDTSGEESSKPLAHDPLLRDPGGDSRRGHGRRLQGPAAGPEPPGRPQDDPRGRSAAARPPRPLPDRGRGGRPAQPSRTSSRSTRSARSTACPSSRWSCSRAAPWTIAWRAIPSRAGQRPS